MARKKSKQNRRAARPEDELPLDVYSRPLTDVERQDELDALVFEPPVFAVPELDAALEGTDREAEQIVKIYLL